MASKRGKRRTHRLNACVGKVAYDTPEGAVVGLRGDKTRVSYHCAHCGIGHNGHPMLRPNATEKRLKGEIVGTCAGLKKAFTNGHRASAGPGSAPSQFDADVQAAVAAASRERQRKRRRPAHLYWQAELARWADDGGMIWPDEDVLYGPRSMGFD